jgi:hypothetical protein
MSYTTNKELMDKARQYNLPLMGVFSKDELTMAPQNGFYILNLQDEVNSAGGFNQGTHWVGIGIEDKKAVYWDSYGIPPPIEVQRFLQPFIPYQYNNTTVQSLRSGWCGFYQLYFIAWMTRQKKTVPDFYKRFQLFLRQWSKDTDKNRTILRNALGSLKGLSIPSNLQN